jgi:2-oxoisovalerate dehydrogenase E2 component (dihydrolipoyl transacylase)
MEGYLFKLPDLGEGAAEAEIAAWHVAVGDTVAEDQPLVDVLTDKATIEIPSPVAGTVVSLYGEPGEKRAVGSDLVRFDVARDPRAPNFAATLAEPVTSQQLVETPAAASVDSHDKPSAAPAVRRRARDLVIELKYVPGTGPGGRIMHADLDAYVLAKAPAAAPATGPGDREAVEEIKIIGLRRRIAERMQQAKRRIPHFSYVEEVDVTRLEELRRHLNAEQRDRPRLTLLPFLVRGLVIALRDHPQINAHFDDEAGLIRRYAAVHIGIATQTSAGLLVPVVHHAEALDLWRGAAELARLIGAAREGTATKHDLSGSTITITSLGALGGIVTTPIINHPEVAILGVNRIVERPVIRDGQVARRQMMNLSSSFDHRVIDGWTAAEFVQRIKGLLEEPATLFITQ